MEIQSSHQNVSTSVEPYESIAYQNKSFEGNVTFMLTNFTFPESPDADSITFLLDFIYVLDEFGVPILLTVGVLSNVILSITVRKSELKKISAFCYFLAMGVVDTIYLIAMAIPWLSIRVINIYNTEGFCQLVYYLNLLTTFLSSWYLVMLLVERLCVCYRPDTAEKYFNAFRTKCYITVVSIFSIVGHLYLTWTSGVYTIYQETKICMVILEHAQDIVVMRKIDTVFSFILPVLLCLVLSLPLAVYLCASFMKCNEGALTVRTRMVTLEVRLNSKKMTRYSECPTCSNAATILGTQKNKLRRLSQSRRVTLVSVLIAFVYALLFIPHSVIKSRVTFLNGDYNVTVQDSLFLKLFEELFKVNFAYKALIYYTLLPEMRSQLIKLLIRNRKKNGSIFHQQKCTETQL